MINLLPQNNLRQLKASRQNTILMRYLILSLISLAAVVLIFGITFIFLKAAEHNGNTTAEKNEQQLASYQNVKKAAAEYEANLKTAKLLLDKNIPYTNALLNIAAAIPENTILQSLNLSPESIKTPVTLNARAASYEDGIKLRDSLSKHGVGTDVKLLSIADERGDKQGGEAAEKNQTIVKYPFSVSIQMNFSSDLLKKPAEKNKVKNKETSKDAKKNEDKQ